MRKNAKIICSVLLVVAMMLGCIGCTTAPAAPAAEETAPEAEAVAPEAANGEPLTVGIALSGINSYTVFIDMVKDIQAKCDAAGYKLMTADTEDNPNKTVTAMENFINAGCDIILLQNFAEDAYVDIMKSSIADGVVWGSFDYDSDTAQYCITAANYDVGVAIGEACGTWVHENEGSKKVALCSYSPFEFLVERERGMRDGFAETCPEGEIVIALDAGDPQPGVTAGENFLQAAPDLQAVMGINDAGTLGVMEAFKAAGMSFEKNKVGIFGCDGSAEGFAAIAANDMFLSTIDLDLVNQFSLLYDRCLHTALTGELIEAEKSVPYPITVVNSENVDQYIK